MRKWIVLLIGVALAAELYWLYWYVNRDIPVVQPPLPANHPVQRLLEQGGASQMGAQKQETLPRGPAEIRGILRGAKGEPAAGALVVVTPLPAFGGLFARTNAPSWRVLATSKGDFHITSLPFGDYLLMATDGREHLLEQVALDKSLPLTELRRTLLPSQTVRGRVVDARGRDVQEARVIPIPESDLDGLEAGENLLIYAHLPAITDSKGEFVLEHLPERHWRLLLQAGGMANTMSEPFTPDNQRLTLVMDSGVKLELALQLPDGAVPQGLRVELLEKRHGVEKHEIALDKGGKAVFAGLRPATWKVILRGSGYVMPDSLREITLAGNEPQTLTATLSPGGLVFGHVRQGARKEGLPGVEVEASPLDTVGEYRATTDTSGRYAFQGLPPGRYRILPHFPDDFVLQGAKAHEITLEQGQEMEAPDFMLIRGMSVQGSVVDAQGKAVGDALVTLEIAGNPPVRREARTNSSGSFNFTGLNEEQTIRVSASSRGIVSAPFGPRVVGRSSLSRIRLTLSQPNRGAIHGVVIDTQGRPVADALVLCTPDAKLGIDPITARTGRYGDFQFNDMVPGSYALAAGRSPEAMAVKNAKQVDLKSNATLENVQLLLP